MEVMENIQKYLVKKDIVAYRAALLHWYGPYGRDLPWRRDFREKGDPYHVWVSEVMLQQTVIKAVLPAYARFMARFPHVEALARATVEEVCQTCHGLGYYRRFRFMHEAARGMAGSDGNLTVRWPQSHEAWREVKGIGAYSAAAIASIALGAPHAVIDGNVERIFCRLLDIRKPVKDPSLAAPFGVLAAGLLTGKPDGSRGKAVHPGDYNQALMELGQRVCTRTTPSCSECPIRDFCASSAHGSQHLAPAPGVRATAKELTVDLFVRRDAKGRVALAQRDEKARFLKQSLGFPWHIGEGAGEAQPDKTALGRFRHTITHHKLDVRVHLKGGPRLTTTLRWVAAGEVEKLLVASLDRKAWRLVLPHLAVK